MTICGHSYDMELGRYMASASRYRLAVILTDRASEDEHILNIGKELASAIKPLDRRPEVQFQFAVQQALDSIIREHSFTDPTFGECIVLANPGILFEPELGIDVADFLRRISKNRLTILLWPGEANEDGLWFLRVSSSYRINNSEINYIIL